MSKDMDFCHLRENIQQIWEKIIGYSCKNRLDVAKAASKK